jgi:REP element-mobilizing transposase RayT
VSPAKIAQYLKGKSSYRLLREFPELKKRYWGSHLWGRGYFCCTVGAVTEEGAVAGVVGIPKRRNLQFVHSNHIGVSAPMEITS